MMPDSGKVRLAAVLYVNSKGNFGSSAAIDAFEHHICNSYKVIRVGLINYL